MILLCLGKKSNLKKWSRKDFLKNPLKFCSVSFSEVGCLRFEGQISQSDRLFN